MKKKTKMLQTLLNKPVAKIRLRSTQAYERYRELFRSIKKLARSPQNQSKQPERDQ